MIEQTGISKRDLIRFIQLKVLPKSMMRVSPAGRDGARKKSYFSRSVLGHVAMLKLLRDEGHSVETIATELRETAEGAPLPRTIHCRNRSTLRPHPKKNREKHTTALSPARRYHRGLHIFGQS